MTIRAILLRGDFTQDEFSRIVALIRDIDTVPDRTIGVMAIDPDASAADALQAFEEALPPLPDRGTDFPQFVARGTTQEELAFLRHNICPDCTEGQMVQGPRGGLSVNIACNYCGTEFTVAIFADEIITAARMSPAGSPNIKRLRGVFGIELEG